MMESKNSKVPQISETELSKVPNNLLNAAQLNFLFSPTPKAHQYERPAKGGGKWTYVTGTYIKKVLNLMFGWNWDFEIMSEIVNIEAAQVIIKGRLTIRTKDQTIVRMQYGRQDLKFKNDYLKDDAGNNILDQRGNPKKFKTTTPLDLGNDLKGAATDSLKKCASEFGIASDIYGKNEFKSIEVIEDADPRDLQSIVMMLDNAKDIDELQMVWDSLSEDEKVTGADALNTRKAEIKTSK